MNCLINWRADVWLEKMGGFVVYKLEALLCRIIKIFFKSCSQLLYTKTDFLALSRVGKILPTQVNPPHKTRFYPGWTIRSYYPLWAICGFYEFLVLKFLVFSLMIDVEMILYSHILIS